jgi:hypothetical protein
MDQEEGAHVWRFIAQASAQQMGRCRFIQNALNTGR